MMPPMARPRAAWITSLGLLGAGWVTAHVLSYVLFVPHAERGEMLARTGHGYFRPSDLIVLSILIALAGALAVVLGGSPGRAPSPYLLGSIPPIGFIVQEHVERTVSGGAFPMHLVTEPRFLLGLVLQLPFALLALLLSRLLVSAAGGLLRRLGGSARSRIASIGLRWTPTVRQCGPRLCGLAVRQGERAPPLAVTA
jgi:hypothetical protein